MKAVEVLMQHGVPEERIVFINLISSPEGLKTFCGKYPALRVVCLLSAVVLVIDTDVQNVDNGMDR